jgi:hypothetical protein
MIAMSVAHDGCPVAIIGGVLDLTHTASGVY